GLAPGGGHREQRRTSGAPRSLLSRFEGAASGERRGRAAIAPTTKEGIMSTKIDRREDVSPKEGERKYGHVEYADPTNKKYPIDTAEHVRAAWSYINHKDNAAKYDADEVRAIKERIKRAASEKGVEISAD